MEIVVRGRHTEVTERFRQWVTEKLVKLDRLDARVISIDVEVSHETNPRLSDVSERVELTCRSRGPVIRAEASADDAHAALDLAYGKLEERLRRAADRRRVHRGARPSPPPHAGPRNTGVRAGIPVYTPSEETPGARSEGDGDTGMAQPMVEPGGLITDQLGVDGDGPLVVREKWHHSEPMTLDQALHEMELVGHNFFLYWDTATDVPSVVYRRRGYSYGVLRLGR